MIKANVPDNTHKKSTNPDTIYQQTSSLTQNSTVPDITHKQHTNRIQNNTYTTDQVIVSDNPANIIKIYNSYMRIWDIKQRTHPEAQVFQTINCTGTFCTSLFLALV